MWGKRQDLRVSGSKGRIITGDKDQVRTQGRDDACQLTRARIGFQAGGTAAKLPQRQQIGEKFDAVGVHEQCNVIRPETVPRE